MKRPVTQRDIAKALGVDVSTVSLALGGDPRIPESTRSRVETEARKQGYVRDPAVATLASQRWQGRRDTRGIMLGFLADSRDVEEPELAHYFAGVKEQARELGYGVTRFDVDAFARAAAFWQLVEARGIRGVLLGQSRLPFPEEYFVSKPTPLVHCGFLHNVNCDMVRPDLRAAVELLGSELATRHRRTVFFLPLERGLDSDRAIYGAAVALAESSAPGRFRVILASEKPTPMELDQLKKAKPDAVVVINEKQAAWSKLPKCPIYTLHTLPPFEGKQGVDLRMEAIGRLSVNLLEMKMRRLPLSSHNFRQSLLVEPRMLSEKCTTREEAQG